MTKTVKLTLEHINRIQSLAAKNAKRLSLQSRRYPTLTGVDMFCEYDKTNLLVGNTGYRCEDILADHENVPLYNLKIDSLGRQTIDLTSVHSTVSVDCYTLENENSTVKMPNAMVDSLIGIVEEVI